MATDQRDVVSELFVRTTSAKRTSLGQAVVATAEFKEGECHREALLGGDLLVGESTGVLASDYGPARLFATGAVTVASLESGGGALLSPGPAQAGAPASTTSEYGTLVHTFMRSSTMAARRLPDSRSDQSLVGALSNAREQFRELQQRIATLKKRVAELEAQSSIRAELSAARTDSDERASQDPNFVAFCSMKEDLRTRFGGGFVAFSDGEFVGHAHAPDELAQTVPSDRPLLVAELDAEPEVTLRGPRRILEE